MQKGMGPRDGRRLKRGEWKAILNKKEFRCLIHMYGLPMKNVIIYCKYVLAR